MSNLNDCPDLQTAVQDYIELQDKIADMQIQLGHVRHYITEKMKANGQEEASFDFAKASLKSRRSTDHQGLAVAHNAPEWLIDKHTKVKIGKSTAWAKITKDMDLAPEDYEAFTTYGEPQLKVEVQL